MALIALLLILPPPFRCSLCQFDMRVYVVVTSVDPLRVYLFKDGLVRLCTEPYVPPTGKNLASTRMHLTNYAINKVHPAILSIN